jgi:ankyrin repeat protein
VQIKALPGMSTFDLFSSVRDGNTEIVRKLLQSKPCRARLNDRNEWGDTALHLAAEAGNGMDHGQCSISLIEGRVGNLIPGGQCRY